MTARWTAGLHRDHDRIVSRTLAYGSLELLYGRPDLVVELPELVSAVSAENVAAAAKALRPDARAVLTLNPANGSAGGTQ